MDHVGNVKIENSIVIVTVENIKYINLKWTIIIGETINGKRSIRITQVLSKMGFTELLTLRLRGVLDEYRVISTSGTSTELHES